MEITPMAPAAMPAQPSSAQNSVPSSVSTMPAQPSVAPSSIPSNMVPSTSRSSKRVSTILWIVLALVIGFALGGVSGYYFSESLIPPPEPQIQQTQPIPQDTATANPYTDVQTNPLQDVKINPFE